MSASAASADNSPAATICPPPFSFAAVKLNLAIEAKTSARSPPNTADIPVGVAALAAAIANPRSRTNTSADSAVIARAPAAAVNSPTEWPATTPTLPNASDGCGNSERAPTNPAATIKG